MALSFLSINWLISFIIFFRWLRFPSSFRSSKISSHDSKSFISASFIPLYSIFTFFVFFDAFFEKSLFRRRDFFWRSFFRQSISWSLRLSSRKILIRFRGEFDLNNIFLFIFLNFNLIIDQFIFCTKNFNFKI